MDSHSSSRQVKSEATSPHLGTSGFNQLTGLPPLDLSGINNATYMNDSMDPFSTMNTDFDAPMYSAGLSAASVDWSHLGLGSVQRESFTPSSYSQNGAQSFNGLFEMGSNSDILPALANTTTTSGDVSEVEDFMPGADADFDSFNSTFMRNTMGGGDLTSIDYDSFFKGAENQLAVAPGTSAVEDDPAFYIQNYNDGMQESPDPLGANTMGNYWES